MAKYIGKRIVPKHCGYWDKTKAYEMECIVYNRADGNSYISRRAVPADTDISQTEYWALCSDFSEQMDLLEKHFTATEQRIKADNDATEQAITQDNADTRSHVDQVTDDALAAMNQAKQAFNTTSAALTARMDSIVGGATTDTEILDARVDTDNVAHTKLQKYISLSHITHKSVRNDATEVPSYYVRNSHVPIVDRRTFDQVQRIFELKAPRGEYSRYPYEDTKAVCPFCGEKLVTRLVHCCGNRKVLGCFGEKGCHKFAVKTWMVDAVLLAAFEELDAVSGTGDGSKRMKEIKAQGTPETVEYYFLADTVKSITFEGTEGTRMQKHKHREPTEEREYTWDMTVNWQSGDSTTLPLPDSRKEEPVHVAELYDRYLDRIQSGEYVPARPKDLRERLASEERRVVKKGADA